MRIGVDVGGTFTDMVVVNDDNSLTQMKALSTPGDPAEGVHNVLEKMADAYEQSVGAFLGATESLAVGTTIATNVMVQKEGAKVGLICTDGFRDTLEIRRGIRDNVWDIKQANPNVIVPRYLRIGVQERIAGDGRIVTPLDEDDVLAAIEVFKKHGVEAIAVCLMNSYVNEQHERRILALLEEHASDMFVTVSCDILPTIGEYERTSTTVINAFVGRKTSDGLRSLAEKLQENGLSSPPWIMQSNGGLVGLPALKKRPVNAVLSGPAGGAASAIYWARLSGASDVVFFDMGGTSTDILITTDGRATISDVTEIAGYHMAVHSIDIRTMGTGGGTIAEVDVGGLLKVGPHSAGSYPGPVCYSNGGDQPTVSDSNVVLGRLNPDNFLKGDMPLDKAAARQVIEEKLGSKLSLSAEKAALAVLRIAHQNMANAVALMAAERGVDLRVLTLVAAGGASSLHVSSVAKILHMKSVYIPREASVACALGMIQTDVRHDSVHTYFGNLNRIDLQDLNAQIDTWSEEAIDTVVLAGIVKEDVLVEAMAELRYVGQQWQIDQALPVPLTGEGVDDLVQSFHATHDRLYGHNEPQGEIEIVNLRISAIAIMPKLNQQVDETHKLEACAPHSTRVGHVEWSDDPVDLGIYDGQKLKPGDTLVGPAIIEEPNTTIFVDQGDTATVDAHNNFKLVWN